MWRIVIVEGGDRTPPSTTTRMSSGFLFFFFLPGNCLCRDSNPELKVIMETRYHLGQQARWLWLFCATLYDTDLFIVTYVVAFLCHFIWHRLMTQTYSEWHMLWLLCVTLYDTDLFRVTYSCMKVVAFWCHFIWHRLIHSDICCGFFVPLYMTQTYS